MKKLKILVFPCGSEIGLEIHRSLKYSSHVELIGASSVDDHGKFVFEEYIGRLPFIDSDNIINELHKIVQEFDIDAIYPAVDKVIWKLKQFENELGCKVISSEFATTEICLSKINTYSVLKATIKVPQVYGKIDEINKYPVFIKPDIGYGTRGVFKANNANEANNFLERNKTTKFVITEYLSGDEYTVDCFTDRHGELKFIGPRKRNRVSNGISVNTGPVKTDISIFDELAVKINQKIKFRGAWFFQVKKDSNGELTLLEIASRLGGSSALYRGKGVNFALLSIFDAFDVDVDVLQNDYDIELDRALDNKYKLDISYSTVYVDFDDCLIINSKVNTQLVSFLYFCLNNGKRLVLLTKHAIDINESLTKYRLTGLFDEVIHIDKNDRKANYIINNDSIFIDDSFVERKDVCTEKNILVFSPDMLEVLMSIKN